MDPVNGNVSVGAIPKFCEFEKSKVIKNTTGLTTIINISITLLPAMYKSQDH